MLTALITAVLSVGIVFGGLFVARRQVTSSVGAERAAIVAQLPGIDKDIQTLLDKSTRLASRSQLETVAKQVEDVQSDLEKEKQGLKAIEAKLEDSQKQVETREAAQQEIKTAKEEDDLKLQEILARFSEVSTESIALEQKLASSMKNLDTLLNEVEFTDDQRAILTELSNNLSTAGERMRDLLTEYNGVNERLQLLTQQHQDLEEEYTRLVEQQLGE